jgi:hypothetical protein
MQIDPIGPTLDVGISSPLSLAAAGAPPPAINWFKAIADTGCTNTSMHSSVAIACGLSVLGKTPVSTPSGRGPVNLYHGDLFLRSLIGWTARFEWKFQDCFFPEMLQKHPSFDILLGMDILNQGVLQPMEA